MRRTFVSLGALVGCLALVCFPMVLGACDRTPAEPITPSADSATAPRRATRCLQRTSDTPPPAVPKGPDAACPPDPEGKPPEVPMGKVHFKDAPTAPVLDVELMLNEARRERGLMFRKELPDARGMLFVFEEADVHSFWMKNTCLPLDMLFVTEDGFLAGIVENVPTMNETGRSVPCKVKYVLEVNAGFTRKYGIKAGQTLQVEGIPGKVGF